MAEFARAVEDLGSDLSWPNFVWLAGLLEAEGTFLKPPPSQPRQPVVACAMTDQDVMERVATFFGTALHQVGKGPHRREFRTQVRGSRAARLMSNLLPLMSDRRQHAIRRALAEYRSPAFKLSFAAASVIRQQHKDGMPALELAHAYGVRRRTIYDLLHGKIYKAPEPAQWRGPSWLIRGATTAGTGLSWAEL